MTHATHTPGPWLNGPQGQPLPCDIGDWDAIASPDDPDATIALVSRHSDARLIAAAPDLLEALETVRRNMRKGVVGEQARRGWAKADVAIAKAKGRSCD